MMRSNRAVAVAFALVSFCCTEPALGQAREVFQIDWASTASARTAVSRSTLRASGAVASDLDRTKMPVLVIDTPDVRAAPRFASQGYSYAAAYLLKDAQLSILGAASGIRVQSRQGQAGLSDAASGFDVTGDGADYSFTRFGASYTLRLTCDDLDDVRCKEPAFLFKIARSLALANPRSHR